MVFFHDTAAAESQNLINLETQIARTVQITLQSQMLDRKLGISKEWVSHLNRKSRGTDVTSEHQRDQLMDDTEDTGMGGNSTYADIGFDPNSAGISIDERADDDLMKTDFEEK